MSCFVCLSGGVCCVGCCPSCSSVFWLCPVAVVAVFVSVCCGSVPVSVPCCFGLVASSRSVGWFVCGAVVSGACRLPSLVVCPSLACRRSCLVVGVLFGRSVFWSAVLVPCFVCLGWRSPSRLTVAVPGAVASAAVLGFGKNFVAKPEEKRIGEKKKNRSVYSVVISYVRQSFCRQTARRQKLPDFAIPTQTTEIDNVESGRLCGLVSFRSFAGLDKNARFFEWLRFWDWQNQSCAAASLHLCSYVRQSFRRLLTAEFVVFVHAPCHWLCCW